MEIKDITLLKEELKNQQFEHHSENERTTQLTQRTENRINKFIQKVKDELVFRPLGQIKREKEQIQKIVNTYEFSDPAMADKLRNAIDALNDAVTILDENNIKEDQEIEVVGARPIKLVSKMYKPIVSVFNFVRGKVENKISEFKDKKNTSKDEISKKARLTPFEDTERKESDIQVVTDFQRSEEEKSMEDNKSSYGLPSDFEERIEQSLKARIEKDNEAEKDRIHKVADKFKNLDIKTYNEIINDSKEINKNSVEKYETKVAIPSDNKNVTYYNSDGSPVLNIDEIKQNYINVVNQVKEQNESLEKKEEEIRKAEEAQKQAEEAQKQVIDKLIQQTIAQQNILSENMERESELNRQLSLKERATARINLETEELLSMLDSSSEKTDTSEKTK